MAERITDKLVRELAAPAKGSRITYDDAIKGFGVRITAAGARAFVINYRSDGTERRFTIGAYPAWSVAAARKEAKTLKQAIGRGEDPMGARYKDGHLLDKRPSSQAEDRAMLARIIGPRLGRRKVANVTRDDVRALHRSLASTPYRANRVVSLLSKMYSLAIEWGEEKPRNEWADIKSNPCRGLKRNHEAKRKRYLAPAEIARLSTALAEYPNQTIASCIRFLLLTGCRKGEALSAAWEQFDLEAGTWTKPAATTKQAAEHCVPLSPPALEILADMQATAPDSRYVFPGKHAGEGLKSIKWAWESIRRAAGIPDVRLHDLRHSFASVLVSSGASLPLIGSLLGHTQPNTTSRYAHLQDDALREATDRAAAIMESAGQPSGEVIPMGQRRR
jgi:integrase